MASRSVARPIWRQISIRRCILGGLVLAGIGSALLSLVSLAGGPLNRHYTRQLGRWCDIWIEEALVTISASASRCAPPPNCFPRNAVSGGPPAAYSSLWNDQVRRHSVQQPNADDEIQWHDRADLPDAIQVAMTGRLFWCGLTDQSPIGAVIRFPLWIVPPLAWAWPCWVLARHWLSQRRRRGRRLCQVCGYHLRGNVSGVCPECGTRCIAQIPSAAAAAVLPRAVPPGRTG